MFKSVFAKYETAFMTIITFGFTMLLVVVTSIVSNYSATMRDEQMKNATEMGKIFIETSSQELTPADFTQTWQNYESDEIQRLLRAFSEEQALSVLVTDVNGTVLFAINGEEAPAFKTGSLLQSDLSAVFEGDEQTEIVKSSASGSKEQYFCSAKIEGEGGVHCGWIVVCSYDAYWGRMTNDLFKTVVTAALLVLLAAVIAAYLITVRTTDPLREMSNAARNFASVARSIAEVESSRIRICGRLQSARAMDMRCF